MTASSPSALDALFRGLVFYGAGGGGRETVGTSLLRQHFGESWLPTFTDPAMLPPESYACATIVLGGRDPDDDMSHEQRRSLGLPSDDLSMGQRFALAIEALERATGVGITALAVVELGSLAMAATLIAADLLGKVVLNSDGTGRSVPELGMAKLDLVGLSPAPAALVDRFGGETVILRSPSAAMADRIGRHVNRAVWGRGLACAGYLQPIHQFSKGVVTGSIPKAATIGSLLIGPGTAEERLAAILAATGGRLLFEGCSDVTQWRSLEPYQFREFEYHVAGVGRDAGRKLRIWVKNEHHMVWCNDVLIATSPDPIMVLDANSLEPLTTLGDVTPGLALLVVAVPALDSIWRSAAGALLLGPRRFGFETDPVQILATL